MPQNKCNKRSGHDKTVQKGNKKWKESLFMELEKLASLEMP